jgi:uncharacterized protein
LEGLLQGTYAHIGVTDFWRVRRFTATDPSERAHAEAEFALWFGHTLRATQVLADSGSLTPLGLRFVEALRTTVEGWTSKVRLPRATLTPPITPRNPFGDGV